MSYYRFTDFSSRIGIFFFAILELFFSFGLFFYNSHIPTKLPDEDMFYADDTLFGLYRWASLCLPLFFKCLNHDVAWVRTMYYFFPVFVQSIWLELSLDNNLKHCLTLHVEGSSTEHTPFLIWVVANGKLVTSTFCFQSLVGLVMLKLDRWLELNCFSYQCLYIF